MNRRQERTLGAVFEEPVSGTIAWTAIENLLVAVGCDIVEGRGSRVRFVKDDMVETFHRPHPAQEAKKYQVRAARDYLTRLGVKP
jgi:HicA toxin of bacterial toxin-antitoxin,